MEVKLESIDLQVITDKGTRCGCCHQPIAELDGVVFGRPCFNMPAMNICRQCVGIALAVLGPENVTQKEGRC